MTIWLSTAHDDAQAIPLLFKEGLGVVDRSAHAGAPAASYPLLRRGGESFSGREGDTRPASKDGRNRKDAKKMLNFDKRSQEILENKGKLQKDEFKMSCFLSAKKAKRTEKMLPRMSFVGTYPEEAKNFSCSRRDNCGSGKQGRKKSGRCEKDVKF
jgi:hypothetical protein